MNAEETTTPAANFLGWAMPFQARSWTSTPSAHSDQRASGPKTSR